MQCAMCNSNHSVKTLNSAVEWSEFFDPSLGLLQVHHTLKAPPGRHRERKPTDALNALGHSMLEAGTSGLSPA